MKVTINIDCSPEEARAFLGLPDLRPMQEEMMQEMQERVTEAVRSMSPEEMVKIWLPAGVAGIEQMQQFFTRIASGRS